MTSIEAARRSDPVTGITSKNFASPDETRAPDKTRLDVISLGSTKIAQLTLQPGWRWSECIKPVAGTDMCQARHVGTVVSGSLHVAHSDGTEHDLGAGDAYVIEPGHDAWVTSSEPYVAYEFEAATAESYAKP
jgi:phosphoketolase